MSKPASKKAQIYARIRRAILSGELAPGEILNEAEIAARFGPGKTPAREALLLLTHEGMLDSFPRVGYIVGKPSLQDILEAFHLRLILEVEAIALAAERLTPEDSQHLQENNREEEKLARSTTPADKAAAARLNREFHLAIARIAGNARLMALIEQLMDDMERMLVNDPYLADPRQHKEVLEALLSGDKNSAQEAMRRHIEETRKRIVNRF